MNNRGQGNKSASTRAGSQRTAYLLEPFERLGTHRDVVDLPLEALTPARAVGGAER